MRHCGLWNHNPSAPGPAEPSGVGGADLTPGVQNNWERAVIAARVRRRAVSAARPGSRALLDAPSLLHAPRRDCNMGAIEKRPLAGDMRLLEDEL